MASDIEAVEKGAKEVTFGSPEVAHTEAHPPLPRDGSEYISLHAALQLVGRRLFGGAWTRRELSLAAAPDKHQGAAFERLTMAAEWIAERAADNRLSTVLDLRPRDWFTYSWPDQTTVWRAPPPDLLAKLFVTGRVAHEFKLLDRPVEELVPVLFRRTELDGQLGKSPEVDKARRTKSGGSRSGRQPGPLKPLARKVIEEAWYRGETPSVKEAADLMKVRAKGDGVEFDQNDLNLETLKEWRREILYDLNSTAVADADD